MEPKTRDTLKQTIINKQDFLENIKGDLEKMKRRKKESEDEARERRKKAAF